jgi:hypothetical protein
MARAADGAGLSREAAAHARAATERLAQVDAALAELPTIIETKRRNGNRTAPRVSTTDPEARVMKMSDGGYRPAYNLQLASDAAGGAVVAVTITNVGNDQRELVPLLNQIERRSGRLPDEVLIDGGYVNVGAIDEATLRGVTVFAPVPRQPQTTTPVLPQPTDSMATALWRTRMQTGAARQVYRTRASVAERVNADLKVHRAPGSIPVRGLHKVQTWALWFALAINVMRVMEIVPHLMT